MGFMSRATAVVESPGRFAILGSTNYTDTQVEMLFYGTPNSVYVQSTVARWVDSSNYLRFSVDSGTSTALAYLVQVVAGVSTTIATVTWNRQDLYYRLRLSVFASGRAIGEVLDATGTATIKVVEGSSSALATGGALDDGKPGMHDQALSTTGSNRYYSDFGVSVPPAEPIVIYSGRNMQIRHDDTIRQDSTGTYTGRPSKYMPAGRFFVPVGTSRVLVKARRNDVDVAADDNVTDATQIQVGITPRGLAVPRS